jgi:hypothetical protein
MSRRARLFAPILVMSAGLWLVVCRDDIARAKDPPAGASSSADGSDPAKLKRTHKGNKRRASTDRLRVGTTRPTAAVLSSHGWASFAEGELRAPSAGAMCPPEMANIDDRYCIDRWEGSLVEVTADGRQTPWPPFGALEPGHALRAVSAPRVVPQAYISGAQAAKACAAAGKRLCAPAEWRKACMGPKETTYGYGNERVAGRCNDSGRSPMLRLFPQVARSWRTVGMTEMNDPRLNQLEATLTPTGSHEGCTNGYGVYDMVGNLHEWTSDPNGTFQGGYYLDTHINGDGCTYRTVAHEFTYHDYSTGFRCCSEPLMP